jgi:tRNA threonylcarbamoyladenosine biosynthesis protein TsaB
MQGLALAQRQSIVPIDAFTALVHATPASGVVHAPWIDAHRGEVFAALYGPDAAQVLVPPSSLSPAATLDAWAGVLAGVARVRFAGDGARTYAAAIRERLGERAILPDGVPPLAGTIARLAAARRASAVAPYAVVPLYVRRTDVERARDRQDRRP